MHTQAVRLSVSMLKDGQPWHAVEANDGAMVDGGQAGHASAPLLAENVPGRHTAQDVTFRNDPAAQGTCAVPPRATTKPASVGVHCVAPAVALNDAGGQGAHSPTATSWKLPAAQAWHTTVLLSADAVGTLPSAQTQLLSAGEPTSEVEPSGHDRQAVPSAAEYVLAPQAVQASAPRCEKVPGAHALHVPFLSKNRPASHGRQPVLFGRL